MYGAANYMDVVLRDFYIFYYEPYNLREIYGVDSPQTTWSPQSHNTTPPHQPSTLYVICTQGLYL